MEQSDVAIREVRFLRGPDLYAYMRVMLAILDIGHYEDRPSTSSPGFTDRLTNWLPGLSEHECSLRHPGGFIVRLHHGTYISHI